LTLHNRDIYSYHEGEETLERGKAPLLPTLHYSSILVDKRLIIAYCYLTFFYYKKGG